MLPNHQPLVVAEQFGTLDALHPGRIDLGIGRAPGTDQRTARALRRGTAALGADDFPEQLAELLAYFRGDGPVLAVPAAGPGARGVAARVERLQRPGRRAARVCRSRSPTTSAARTRCPRWSCTGETFRPSEVLDAAVRADRRLRAVRAETDAEAQPARAAVGAAVPAAAASGRPGLGADARGGGRVPVHRRGARRSSTTGSPGQVIGSPETVRAGVTELVERTGVDELMVVTSTHDGADRLRSYRLLAEALDPATAPATSGTTSRMISGARRQA